ncbi:C25 family cysteine peptidase [Candidatus Zixiibacteriota bacterium]
MLSAGFVQAEVTVETAVTFSAEDLLVTELSGYDLISLPVGGSVEALGHPMLPVHRVNVAIPAGHEVKAVKALAGKSEELAGTYRILPAQHPRKISDPRRPEEIPFVQPDPRIYASNEPYPASLTSLLGQADLVGQQMAAVELHPVQWNPATGKVTFHQQIHLTVICQPGNPSTDRLHKMSDRGRRVYQEMAESMVVNPQDVRLPMPMGAAAKDLGAGDYDHVIIADSTFRYFFGPLLQWHYQKGLRDTLVSLQWIKATYSGADDQERIRNFIIEAHSTWGANYFLLGGDAPDLPVKMGYYNEEWVASDLYYADYDDDWVSEVFVGRAPARNTTQVSTFVNKVLKYEKDPPLTDFALDCLLIGMDLDEFTPTENLKEAVDSDYIPSRFNLTKVYDSDTDNHWTKTMNALNTGQNLVNHSDHSNATVMGVGSRNHGWHIDNGDVDDLTNTDQTSVIYSLGCHPAEVDYYDCIGEHFITYNPGQAGVAFTGNTRSGYYYVGQPGSLSGYLDKEWWRSLFNYSKYRVGETLADHRNRNYPAGETWQYLHWGLILLGEPEMPIWTDDPAVPSVTHPAIFTTGAYFPVHVEADGQDVHVALVCLWKDGEVYLRDYTDSNGDVVFMPLPTSVGSLYVTVTKQNILPYEGAAEVLLFSPPDPAWTGEGDQLYASYGWSVSKAGDVDGDGYGDVIVGSALHSNGEDYEGCAFLYNGSSSGLSASHSWLGENDVANSYLGNAVDWAGDVNGDGYSDVIVGAQGYSDGQSEEGAAYLYFGGSSGLSTQPDWSAEGDQVGAYMGYSVAGAGDVNGDGYSDVIVGAAYADVSGTDEGRVYLYFGSASGPSETPDWTVAGAQNEAHFGFCVSTAGDVNGDGYSDVIVGEESYNDFTEPNVGRAYLFLGGPSGPALTPDWTVTGDDDYANLGYSVASAGDVNGDGYSDVIVGAPTRTENEESEGRVYLYLGGSGGLSATPDWTKDGEQAGSKFGYSVSSAGDMSGDGYCDVVVGAESYEDGQANEGMVMLFLGGQAAPYLIPAWRAQRDQAQAAFGCCVHGAGDVNGDGYDDILAGACLFDNGQEDEGQAYLFTGDAGVGSPFRPRQARADGFSLIGPLGASESETQVRLRVTGWYPGGGESVKLQWEVKALGTNFDSTGLGESTSWSVTDSANGVELDELITGLTASAPYHWRARVLYQPGNPLGLNHSIWLSPSHNSWNEADFRTGGGGGNPPGPISDLSATLMDGAKSTSGDIRLDWTEPFSEGGVSHYVVYRSALPTQMGDSLGYSMSTEYTDAGAAGDPASNHYYSIKAVDSEGRKSAFSNQVGEFDLELLLPDKAGSPMGQSGKR